MHLTDDLDQASRALGSWLLRRAGALINALADGFENLGDFINDRPDTFVGIVCAIALVSVAVLGLAGCLPGGAQ